MHPAPDIPTGRTDAASRLIHAPPQALYAAFVDPERLMAWLPPKGMTGRALEFDPRQGGRYRVELTYETAEPSGGAGKSTARTDISTGRFLELEPGRRIVQSVEFESNDPAYAGEMRIIWTFEPEGEATRVAVTAEDAPPGISAEDHAAGLDSSLENLARFVGNK